MGGSWNKRSTITSTALSSSFFQRIIVEVMMSVSQEEWMVTQSKPHCLLPPFIGSIFLIIPFKNIVISFYSAPKYINILHLQPWVAKWISLLIHGKGSWGHILTPEFGLIAIIKTWYIWPSAAVIGRGLLTSSPNSILSFVWLLHLYVWCMTCMHFFYWLACMSLRLSWVALII